MSVRLDKLISSRTSVTRSQIRALVRAGRVTVDGATAASPDLSVSETAAVAVDGRPIPAEQLCYLMLNKPAGVLSAVRDSRQKTVLDLVPEPLRRKDLFPVGRLDKDTTGLLILTNDGAFAHRVLAPRAKIPKVYLARLDVLPGEDARRAFAAGLILSDGTACLPAELEPLGDDPPRVRVTVFEGKYHQVKRMLGAVGAGVCALHRSQIGALELDPALAPGACRSLSEEELRRLTLNGKG